MKQIELVATDEVQGFRVDKAISVLYGDLSRSAVQNLLEEQKILGSKSLNYQVIISQSKPLYKGEKNKESGKTTPNSNLYNIWNLIYSGT